MNFVVQNLPFEITDVEYSAKIPNVFACSTFQTNHWYHDGTLNIFKYQSATPNMTPLHSFANKIGVKQCKWSEKYYSMLVSANDDGTISFFDANQNKQNDFKTKILIEKGHCINTVSWNQLFTEYILTGSTSSTISLLDIQNLQVILTTFEEHTKSIFDIKWNTNNADEFASVSLDGLIKIWDRRTKDSVNTLLDRESNHSQTPCSILSCDWNKKEDYILAVANSQDQILIWDIRNSLQPLKRRFAHRGSVTNIKFDTTQPGRLASCGSDATVRIWNTDSDGIYLTQEHKIHRKGVSAVDWNLFAPNTITSVGQDQSIIIAPLESMVQVQEFYQDGILQTHKKSVPMATVSKRDYSKSASSKM